MMTITVMVMKTTTTIAMATTDTPVGQPLFV
jgi:hypothetical protein